MRGKGFPDAAGNSFSRSAVQLAYAVNTDERRLIAESLQGRTEAFGELGRQTTVFWLQTLLQK